MLLPSALRRWAAALLLLASPALGGQVVPVLHPCAVEGEAAEAHGTHGGHEGHGQAPTGGDSACTCVGDCQPVVGAPTPPTAAIVSLEASPPDGAPNARIPSAPRAIDRPLDRQPPPTAPPLA